MNPDTTEPPKIGPELGPSIGEVETETEPETELLSSTAILGQGESSEHAKITIQGLEISLGSRYLRADTLLSLCLTAIDQLSPNKLKPSIGYAG